MHGPATDTPLEVLREVMDGGHLAVAYQPIVDLERRRIFAYEALARCTSKAFAGPLPLFAAAVQHGLTGELGRQLRHLSITGCPHVPLFINIHPNELNDKFLIQPDDPLFQHYSDVYLEITESVPLSHFSLCQSILTEIRDRGVHLVVDDLGAGYSNLKYIVDLHPRVVKVDRGLVMGLKRDSRLHKLLIAIVRLCNDLGAKVVAEGIETADELDAVMGAGVHYGQGYVLARPAFTPPAAEWPAFAGEEAKPIPLPRVTPRQTLRGKALDPSVVS